MGVNKTSFEVQCFYGLRVLLDSGCWFLLRRNVLSFAVCMNLFALVCFHPAAGRKRFVRLQKSNEAAIKTHRLGSQL